MSLHDAIARAVAQATGEFFNADTRRAVSGGSINTTEVLEGSGRKFFVKLNTAIRLDMFEAEVEGLAEIANSESVRVPQPVCCGTQGGFTIGTWITTTGGVGGGGGMYGSPTAGLVRSSSPVRFKMTLLLLLLWNTLYPCCEEDWTSTLVNDEDLERQLA